MNLKKFIPSEELDDVLWELSASEPLGPELVKAAIARHPEFGKEILEFAAEWIEADALSGSGSDGITKETASDYEAELTRFWEESSAEGANPFDSVSPPELRAVAQDCEIPVTVLMLMCRRLIDVATIPLLLIEKLASGLRTSPSMLLQFIDGKPQLANADYKSPKGAPRNAPKMSFAEAIEKSPMDKTLKAKWRHLGQ